MSLSTNNLSVSLFVISVKVKFSKQRRYSCKNTATKLAIRMFLVNSTGFTFVIHGYH